MVKLTPSLKEFLMTYYRDRVVLIVLGHTEFYTEEMDEMYKEWLKRKEEESDG